MPSNGIGLDVNRRRLLQFYISVKCLAFSQRLLETNRFKLATPNGV